MLHQELSKLTITYVKNRFKHYYSKTKLPTPPNIHMREIALQPFGQDTYIRHLSFNDITELTKYILDKVPRNLFYSSALYEYPSAKNMDEKVWLGSDLIFDIDSDQIKGCIVKGIWICEKLHYGEGDYGDKCPRCGSKIITTTDIIPKECLDLALDHVIKLYDVLVEDFGISKDRIHVYFSGNRGFHVHVHASHKEMQMSSELRREIVDYIKGIGLDVNSLLLNIQVKGSRKRRIEILLPSTDDYGWRRRIAKALKVVNLEGISRDAIIENCIDNRTIEVDEKVTIDTKRLIRFPLSLHGKSGLMVIPVDLNKGFDLYKAVPRQFMKDSVKIIPLIKIDKLDLFQVTINASPSKKMKVDEYIGIYLALKGLAYIVG